jgi:hypothetical protein
MHALSHFRRIPALGACLVAASACSGSGASARQDDTTSSRVIPAAAALQTPTTPAIAVDDTNRLVVYKSPTCGCCRSWVEHMQRAGFTVVVHDTDDVQPVKDESRVPVALRSCHTAIVGRYVIEGHVPAADVRRLLRERPAVAGLAVPGMPAGSPGMEGGVSEPYDVMTFGGSSPQRVFARH